MADFSYLDSTGIGQIDTPFQIPKTLDTNSTQFAPPPQVGPIPQGQGPIDFANLWKGQQDNSAPTPLFNDTLDTSKFKGNNPPRSFDADRLVPYKQSGAYKDVGYNPNMPEDKIQAQYDYDQSNWEAAKSSIGDLFHVSGQAFVNYFKTYGNTVKSMMDSNQQGIMYNDFIPQQEADTEAARNNLRYKGDIPMHWYNYIPLPGLMKGDVAEELLPQLGFTLGTGAAAVVENLGVSLLTGGVGEGAEAANSANKMYKLISEFSTIGRGAELAKSMAVGAKIGDLRTGLELWRLTNSTLSETSLDAAQEFVQHKQKLIQDYVDKNGHAPAVGSDDMNKIESSAHNAANDDMWGEFPVLFVGNFVQYRNLLSPTIAKQLAESEALKGMSIINKATDGIASEFAVEDPSAAHSALGRFAHGAAHFAKNATAEGLEESGQNFVQNVSSDYEQNKYNGKNNNLMDSVLRAGVPDILSDNGLQQFMGGFVTGSVFHSFGMLGNKLATMNGVFDANGKFSGKQNLLTRLGFGTEEIAKAKVKDNLQTISDILNTEDLKSIFKEEGLATFIKASQDGQAMNAALAKNDLFNIGNLKSNALVRFLWTGMETGKMDLRLNQLNQFRDLPQDDLNKFLGVDTGAINQHAVSAVVDHIIDKANQVAPIFDQEKQRYAEKESKANQAFQVTDKDHQALEQELRTKYGIDANENDLRAPLVQRLTENPDSQETKDDLQRLQDSITTRNKAYMNAIAVREGRKAAVFAAANMDIDSERSKELQEILRKNPAYLNISNSLNLKDIDEQIKQKSELAKAVQGVDNELMLKTNQELTDLGKLRHHLGLFYGDSNEIHPYGLSTPPTDLVRGKIAASALYNFLNSADTKNRNRQKDEEAMSLLLNLEKKNKDNLSLYNRLTTSDSDFDTYSKTETEKTSLTIGKWFNEYIKQNQDKEPTSVAETTPEQEAKSNLISDTPEEKPTASPIQQKFDFIKNKVEKGEPLDQQEEQFLQQGAAVNPEMHAFAQKYEQNKTEQTEPAADVLDIPAVAPVDQVYSSEDHKVSTEGQYIPEPNLGTKQDELVETSRVNEHNGAVIDNPNRTIVNEVPRDQMSKAIPKLTGGYTAWKQGFFDYVAQNDLLDRYQGSLQVDKAENYPEDSNEYKFLKNNPSSAGLVLVVSDKAGNETFGKNYLPSTKGDKIVHSIPNSLAKTNLLGILQQSGSTIPVEFSSLSQGIFDELEDPRSTAKLVDEISTADYQYTIASGPVGETIYYDNGMALRNGGAYIKTQGSYIKLLPDYAANLNVNGINPDVTGLIGLQYPSYKEALNVAEFLQKLFYTNKEKGGIEFSIKKDGGGKFTLAVDMKQVGRSIPLSPEELIGALKTQRLNVDKSSIGQNIDFYHVVNGSVEKMSVPYNDILRDNTLTNKKAYETADGKKVLKPVNRYLTIARNLSDVVDELKTPTKVVEAPKEEPTEEPTKSKRRKFDTGRTDEGFEGIDKLFKAKLGTNELTVPMQAEADWINARFNSPDLAKLKDIVDSGAWGVWTTSGINLLRNAPEGTGYHEAFHHFSQLYLTPDQRARIYNEARSRVHSLAGASDFQVEEHLAEDFRGYVLSKGTKILGDAPARNTIFRRILDFLRRVFGRPNLDRVYKDLYSGELKEYRSNVNNAQFGKLNSKLTDREGNELMSNQRSYRLINHMEAVAGQILAKSSVSPAQFMTGDRDIDKKRAIQLGGLMKNELMQQANDLDEQITQFEAKHPNKSTPLLETWNNLHSIIDNFGSVFVQYYKQSAYNAGVSNVLSADDIDAEASDQAEANFGGKGWDSSGNEEGVLDGATSETRALIQGLAKVQVDKAGNPMKAGGKVQLFTNEQGLHEPVQLVRTVNNIANLLEGSFSYKEMLDKIKDSGNQRRFPELALLQERLPDYTQPLKYTEVRQLSGFLKTFSKTYVPIYTLVRLLDGNFLFREETRNSQSNIEKEWGNNFTTISKDSPYVTSGIVQFDENDKPYINPQANLDFNLQDDAGRKQFLNFLGINISSRAEGTRAYEDATRPEKLGYLLQSIRNRLKAGQKVSNPVNDLRKSFTPKGGGQVMSEKTTVNELTKLEGKFTDTNPSMSFRNAEGNMQHGLSENNWVTNNNYTLSRAQNYSQIVENPNTQHLNKDNNPYIQHSLFLNKLFNLDPTSQSYGQRRRVNGEPVTITFGNYNGYDREVEGKNNEGATTTKLNPHDKLIMDMNSLLIAGAVELMRTESSGSAFFAKLSDYASVDGKVQDLPFTPQEIGADPRAPKVMEYFQGAAQDELSTIVNKYNSPLPKYNSNIGRFTMFDDILSDKTKKAIMSELTEARDNFKLSPEEKQAIVDRIYKKHATQIDKETGDFLEKQVKDFEKLMNERDVNFNDISKTLTQADGQKLSMPEITTAFVLNDFVLNSEFIKLFDGNVGFFKAYHKRAKGNTSTGVRASTDDFLKAYLNNTKQSTLAGSLGDKSDVNLSQTKTLTFKDDNRKSVYTTERASLYKRALKALNGGVDDEVANAIVDSKYNAMNVADGQGHATLDFYREMRMRVSNWSMADEVQYQKEVIGYREVKGLYGNTVPEEQRAKDQKFLEDYKDTSSTFPPMKMQYNGPLVMPGVFAPVLDKFSVMPLIPSILSNTVWDGINDKLLKEGIGYTKFESGTKKYKYTPEDFYKATDGYTTSLGDHNVPYDYATHTAEGLKEQLRTSSDPKEEATWGTQMRKLFLANLFNSGIADDKFRNVLNNYIDLLNKVQDQQRGQLYKEFGIHEDNGNIVIKDVKNFVTTLQRQVDSRQLNDNIKNFVQYDPSTKSFVYPLEVSLNKSQVQDLISGMIFNRLTRLKVNGDMLIQVASSGFESPDFKYTNATTEDNLKYGSNGLPFYEPTFDKNGNVTGTKAMRVKIALIKEWTKLLNAVHPDGKKMGTLERLNEALRDDKWRDENRRRITMIGYRIPTQGANSMEFMEVHEFLPSVAGSIVILPAEIVAKAGSDYDIDKLPIIRPSLTDEGEMADEAPEVYEKKMQAIRKQLEGLFKKEQDVNSVRLGHDYSDVDRLMDKIAFGADAEEIEQEIDGLVIDNDKIQEKLGQYMRAASNRQGALTNKVVDLYKEVLSSPEMFKQLITPNNVDMMKPVAQEIAKMTSMAGFDNQGNTKEFTNTNVLEYRSNLVKFEQLLSGKRDVGIFAKANTMSQLLQQAGMLMNKEYTIFEPIRGIITPFKRQLNQLLLSPEERTTLQATKATSTGDLHDMIDYSSNKDVTGIYKQEYLSQLINGTVDVAGDPWYMGLRLNDRVKGAFVHMLNQGIPAKRAAFFVNHPAVQDYTNRLILEGNQQKWNIIGEMLGMNNPRKLKVLAMIEAIDSGKNSQNGFYFKESELAQHIKDPSSAKDWYNRQVLAHFLKSDEQGNALRELQTITSFDTAKYLTPISAQNNLDLREKVQQSGLFDYDAVQKIMQHSMISPFNNINKNIDIFSKLMPIGMHKQVVEASAEVMRQFMGSQKDRIRLERVLNNDWIEFIVKNYGQINGMNFEDYAKDLIVFNGGNDVLANQLRLLKNRMPELNQFDAFRRLYNNTSERSPGWRNIELQRGLDNSSDFQNILIEDLTQLTHFQGDEIAGHTFTPEQVADVRQFFTKLGYLAFMQSGFNRSALYFTDVIPSENLAPILKDALNSFQKVVGANPQAMDAVIQGFIEKFKEQNPTFVIGGQPAPFRESFRGKLYKIIDNTSSGTTESFNDPDYVPGGDFQFPDMNLHPNDITNGLVTKTPDFKTWDLGAFEGKPEALHEKEIDALAKANPDEKAGGTGESFNQFKDRVINRFRELLQDAPDNTLILTHSSVIKVLEAWDKAGRQSDNFIDIGHYLDTQTQTGNVYKFKSNQGTLIVARHGQTDDNLKGNLRSNSTQLTDKGRQQAAEVGESLRGTKIAGVVSSNLDRAVETSEIILSKQTQIGPTEQDVDQMINDCN